MDAKKICMLGVLAFFFLASSGCFDQQPSMTTPISSHGKYPGAGGDPGNCGATLSANTYYTLASNKSIAANVICYTFGGDNITLDCSGYSITYTGPSLGHGVGAPVISVANQRNVAVKNCLLNNFPTGPLFDTTNNITLSNNSIFNTSWIGFFIRYGDTNSSLYNNSASSSGLCYYIGPSSTNITAYNNTATLCSDEGYSFSQTAFNSTYANNTANSCQISLQDYQGAGNNFIGNTIYNSTQAIWLYQVHNDIITNNTITNTSTAIYFEYLSDTTSSNNTFLGNNITASVWVDDISSSPNYYNNSNSGNIYYFVNGTPSWSIFNISSNNSSNWANQGTSRPFNHTTVGGNWSNKWQDWYPWTGNINSTGAINLSISGVASKDVFRIIYSTLPATCIAATNQTNSVGIYNITNTGSSAYDAYFYVNQTISCMNLSVSNDSTCANAITLNTTHQKIYNALGGGSSVTIWAWAAADTCLPIPIPKFNVSASAS